MNAFLVSVLSGLVAAILFEVIRSPHLRRRIGSLLMSRQGETVPAPAILPVWLSVRVMVTVIGAFVGSSFLAAVLEQIGHAPIALGEVAGILLAAIAGLGAWTASRTARRLIRVTVSFSISLTLILFVLLPVLRPTGWLDPPAAAIALLFLVYLALWEGLGLLPALKAGEPR